MDQVIDGEWRHGGRGTLIRYMEYEISVRAQIYRLYFIPVIVPADKDLNRNLTHLDWCIPSAYSCITSHKTVQFEKIVERNLSNSTVFNIVRSGVKFEQ